MCRMCYKKRMLYNILGVITTVDSRKRMKSRGTTSVVNSLEVQDPCHANIQVNGKKVNFRVDTRADVTVVPSRYFTKTSKSKNSQLLQKTNKKLFGPGKTKSTSSVSSKRHRQHTETKQTLFVDLVAITKHQ